MRSFTAAAFALMLIPVTLAASGLPRNWEYAPQSYLRRAPAETGAPANGQPLQVDPALLKGALGGLRVVLEGKEAALFVPEEAERLASALARVLVLAKPDEDLEVLSTFKRDKGWLTGSPSVEARVFIHDGKLNVIVHDPRLDWIVDYNLTQRFPTFVFGSRTKPSPVVLKADGAELPRADWAILSLTPPPPSQPTPTSKTAGQPQPAPAAQPTGTVEERLRGLKQFRDQNLITEEEYVHQKQDLLKAYTQSN